MMIGADAFDKVEKKTKLDALIEVLEAGKEVKRRNKTDSGDGYQIRDGYGDYDCGEITDEEMDTIIDALKKVRDEA